MRTVCDFKKAGLALVDGDECQDSNGLIYSSVRFAHANVGDEEFDLFRISDFAWRTNTGVKPEFVGEVELMDGNHNTGVKHSSKVNWEKHPQAGDASICQWRPHLPAAIQTETPEEKEAFEAINKSPYDVGAHVSDASKPVYTQAMCDAGEFPPVGVDCQYETTFFSMDKYNNGTCRPIAYFNGKVWIDIDGGQESVINLNSIKFKPIKTEREKAIDEMVATAVNSADDIAKSIIYEACVKLAEAGYTKETK